MLHSSSSKTKLDTGILQETGPNLFMPMRQDCAVIYCEKEKN